MSFVVVNMSTRCAVKHPRTRRETYSTEAAARAAKTRMEKTLRTDLEVMTGDAYRAQVPMREVTNLMTGEKVMLQADLVGSACDPSTESYWSA